MKRSRFFIITGVTVAVAAIVIAIICIVQCSSKGTAPLNEPVIPTVIISPGASNTPAPSPSPSPTAEPVMAYRLPLVPVWDEPTPTPSLSPPLGSTPSINIAPTQGQYSNSIKDFLAVGTTDGVATAIFLVRLTGTELRIIALPFEATALVYTLDNECQISAATFSMVGDATRVGGSDANQRAWNLIWAVKNLSGVQLPHYLCIELECLPAVLDCVGSFEGTNATFTSENIATYLSTEREQRTYVLLDIGVGLLKRLRQLSLWELPSIQKATKGHVLSSLGAIDLIPMARSLQGVTSVQCYTLPLVERDGKLYIDENKAEQIIRKVYE